MVVSRIENKAQVIADCNEVTSNTVETFVKMPPVVFKDVDKSEACIGDILNYSVTIRNDSMREMTNVIFSDTIPTGTIYVPDSFEFNGVVQSPIIDQDTIYYTISSIEALRTVIITFQVKVTA